MLKILDNSVNGIADVCEACVDEETDLTAPENQIDLKRMGMGSKLLIIETGKNYIKNSKGIWKSLNTNTTITTEGGSEMSESEINELISNYLETHNSEITTEEELNNILKDYVKKSDLNKPIKVEDNFYSSLEDAIANITTGTIVLQEEIMPEAQISIEDGQDITIDLNGHNITAKPGLEIAGGLLSIKHGATLTINGKGSVNGVSAGGLVYAGIALTAKGDAGDTKPAVLIVNDGEITGSYYGIVGNGSLGRGNTKIIINGGHIKGINATEATGIYNPQLNSEIIVNGGTIEGTTGIEIRSGNLTVNQGLIIGNGMPLSVSPNGNGTTNIGAGIAIAQHTTKQPINVVISGGMIKGFSALYESNPQKNSAEDIAKVNISIAGGSFLAINGGTNVVYSEDKEGFISGGSFLPAIDSKYKL